VVRDRDHRPCRARVATAPGRRRDRQGGAGADRAGPARRAARRAPPSPARPRIGARVDDRGRLELSSYPARCIIGLERRTLPGETRAGVEREVTDLLDRCRASDPGLRVEQRTLLVREPFEIGGEAEVVRLTREAAADALRRTPKVGGVSYWADSAFIAAAGIPTVLFGPGGEGAHAAEEWVSLADTEAVAATLVGVAERFCA
jgi:acetylornithine deacetylase